MYMLVIPNYMKFSLPVVGITMSGSTPASIPSVALAGFASSEAYDAHRPTYQPAAVNYLLTSLGLSGRHRGRVMDIGAGTGKFTEILAKREEYYDIVAVEPHDDMRRVLRGKELPRTKVLGGDVQSVWSTEGWRAMGEDWSPESIVIAQVFKLTYTPLCDFGTRPKNHKPISLIYVNIDNIMAPIYSI